MAEGLAGGRTLTQEEWAGEEIHALDELIAEGKAVVVADWEYLDAFQCSRRRVRGVPA